MTPDYPKQQDAIKPPPEYMYKGSKYNAKQTFPLLRLLIVQRIFVEKVDD